MHEKLIASTTMNGEMLETFLIRSGTRHGCSVLSYPFSIVLEVLDRASRREKENGVMSMGKDGSQFFPVHSYDPIYREMEMLQKVFLRNI